MNSTLRRIAAPSRFVGSEANLKRLVRLGWRWPKDGKIVVNPACVVTLDQTAYEAHRHSLSNWPYFAGPEIGPYGSGGGALGSGGGPLGSGGGPLGFDRGYRGVRRHVGMGYHPDLPDWRDHKLHQTIEDAAVPGAARKVLQAIQSTNLDAQTWRKKGPDPALSFLLNRSSTDSLPEFHDLRYTGDFSPIEDQGSIGSCTAQAVIALVEYLQRAGTGQYDDMSRLFNYKTSRRLLGLAGDAGSYLRSAIKALALFGTPPENEWPYQPERFDDEPMAYQYAYGQNFKALNYTRLDGDDNPLSIVLDLLKRTLLDGFPVAFGFTVFNSIDEVSAQNGFVIPFPRESDSVDGGHAVVAVGYDDDYLDAPPVGGSSKGVIIIRNSWSTAWGEAGYGYLPQDYVTTGLARDFWTIFNQDWIDLARFD